MTQVVFMSEKHPELLTKLRISGKLFEDLVNAKSAQIKVPEYFWYWSGDSEIMIFSILEVSLSLT